jgi:hypothetical protein
MHLDHLRRREVITVLGGAGSDVIARGAGAAERESHLVSG